MRSVLAALPWHGASLEWASFVSKCLLSGAYAGVILMAVMKPIRRLAPMPLLASSVDPFVMLFAARSVHAVVGFASRASFVFCVCVCAPVFDVFLVLGGLFGCFSASVNNVFLLAACLFACLFCLFLFRWFVVCLLLVGLLACLPGCQLACLRSSPGYVAPRFSAADWDADGDVDLIVPRGRRDAAAARGFCAQNSVSSLSLPLSVEWGDRTSRRQEKMFKFRLTC